MPDSFFFLLFAFFYCQPHACCTSHNFSALLRFPRAECIWKTCVFSVLFITLSNFFIGTIYLYLPTKRQIIARSLSLSADRSKDVNRNLQLDICLFEFPIPFFFSIGALGELILTFSFVHFEMYVQKYLLIKYIACNCFFRLYPSTAVASLEECYALSLSI